jgi:hypothetical protein
MIKNSLPVAFTVLRSVVVVLLMALAFLSSGASATPDIDKI